MPPTLKAEDRRRLADEAYELSIKRVTYTEIGVRLGITRQLASTLVREEKDRISSDKEKEDARQKSISTYEKVIAYGWELLESEELKANSLNQSGVMNSITTAQKAIDEIEGSKAPTRSESDVNLNINKPDPSLDEYFAQLDAYREGDGEADNREPVDTTKPETHRTTIGVSVPN